MTYGSATDVFSRAKVDVQAMHGVAIVSTKSRTPKVFHRLRSEYKFLHF
jgi:hypothetical protein